MSSGDRTLRYRRWAGNLGSGRGTWLSIVENGVRINSKGRIMRLIAVTTFTLTVACVVALYFLSQLELLAQTREGRVIASVFSGLFQINLRQQSDFSEFREVLWRSVFLLAIRLELIWVVIVAAKVGAPLISRDLKTNALPIYFSRPVTPVTYLLAKWLIVAIFVAMVTAVPNLAALLLGTMLTGGLAETSQTLHLAFDLMVCAGAAMILAGAVILVLSSLTSSVRTVMFGWLIVVILPIFVQRVITEVLGEDRVTGFLASLSPYSNFTKLAFWFFDIHAAWQATSIPAGAVEQALGQPANPLYPGVVFLGVLLLSVSICYWRVVKLSRTAANVS